MTQNTHNVHAAITLLLFSDIYVFLPAICMSCFCSFNQFAIIVLFNVYFYFDSYFLVICEALRAFAIWCSAIEKVKHYYNYM